MYSSNKTIKLSVRVLGNSWKLIFCREGALSKMEMSVRFLSS